MNEIGVFEVTVIGGEPLLRKDLYIFIRELRRHMINVKINTNGTLLNDIRAHELRELGVREVRIGLDGHNRAINDMLRGKGSFDLIVRGIKAAKDAGLKVIISAVITKINLKYLYELIKFVYNIGVDNIILNQLIPVGRAKKHWNMLALNSLNDYREIKKIKDRTEREFPGFASWYMDPLVALLMNEKELLESKGSQSFKWIPGRYGSCGMGLRTCSIKSNGDVVPCLAIPNYVCDNIREQSLIDIWRKSPKFNRLRKLFGAPLKDLSDVCATCKWNRLCTGGCPAITYAVYGDFKPPSPLCNLIKEL